MAVNTAIDARIRVKSPRLISESTRVVPSLHRFKVAARDRARFLGSLGGIGHAIELDHAPAVKLDGVERGKDGVEIHASPSQLDKTIAGEVLDVEKQQPARVLAHGHGRIAARLLVMRRVEQEVNESGIGGVEHARDFFGRLTQGTPVMMVAERHAALRGAIGPGVERRLSQLYAAKADGGDVVDSLAVIAVPGNGRVTEADARCGAAS